MSRLPLIAFRASGTARCSYIWVVGCHRQIRGRFGPDAEAESASAAEAVDEVGAAGATVATGDVDPVATAVGVATPGVLNGWLVGAAVGVDGGTFVGVGVFFGG